jgi:hypothetical protein
MRERPTPSRSPSRAQRSSESPLRSGRRAAVAPSRSMSAPLSQPVRQSAPAASSRARPASGGSVRSSSGATPAPAKGSGIKSMSVGFGRHSSEAPLLQRKQQVAACATVPASGKGKSKLKKRKAAGGKAGSDSVAGDILGGEKPTRMRARQTGGVAAGKSQNPYLATNPLAGTTSPAPTRATAQSPSPNIVGASIKVSPALSAVSGLTASTVGSRSVGANSATSKTSKASSGKKKGAKKGKKGKGKTTAAAVGEDFMSPATRALERKLGNAVHMLTKHVATVSRQLHVATDIISEQVNQGMEAIHRSAEKAQALSSSAHGSPFSLLQSVNSNGSSPSANPSPGVSVNSASKVDSNPNVFANLTPEEEEEVRELIQVSLRERIAAIYLGAK